MITLERAKLHLRIDHDVDDDYIKSLIAGAWLFIEKDLNRKLYEQAEDIPTEDKTGIKKGADLEQAALLLVGNWYENREASDTQKTEIPLAYWRIVQHYRLYGA